MRRTIWMTRMIAVKRAQSRGRITTQRERLLKVHGVTNLPLVYLPCDWSRPGDTYARDGGSLAAESGTEYT